MANKCAKCTRPQVACLCEHLVTLETNTHFVILMHPKEFKKERVGTGKLAHVCLPNSEILWDENFTDNKRVNELINDPSNYAVLMYPGDTSKNLSKGEFTTEELSGKRLVVFLLDGTWPCAKKMLRLSTNLQILPRLMFTPSAPSQFHIKQQPHEICLSTIETIYQFLEVLSEQKFEDSKEWSGLLRPFMAMQRYQIEASQDPTRQRYRTGRFKTAEERQQLYKERSRKLFF